MKPTFDEGLRPFATDAQWAAYEAYCDGGSYGEGAKIAGSSKAALHEQVKRVFNKALRAGYVPPGYEVSKVSVTRDEITDTVERTSTQVRPAGGDLDDMARVPDPKKIVKTSTLSRGDGSVIQQWVMEKPEDAEREKLWHSYAAELSASVDRAPPVPRPQGYLAKDLLACYPVGDHHLGMLAWGKETDSESYDMKISEELLRGASTYLMSQAPPCEQALVAFLGDFLHYDSFETVTPTSHNLLDADGRYPKMVRTGVRMMRHMIDAALERHGRVHVIVEIGNHDLSSSVFLMECLRCVYEKEPRVEIDTQPSHYHYYRFGTTLIGTHHGHGAKVEKLPLVMAADRPREWGATAHRYWWTGHIHNRTAQDFHGCSVESFRILAPVDAWAAQKGYRPIRDMKSIIIHKEHGEVARNTVSPAMFQEAAHG